jgi:hypothetical protein
MIFVQFEFLTVVVMVSYIFWDIMLCSPLEVNQLFREHIISIFRVKEKVKQETSVKERTSRANLCWPVTENV